MTPSLAFIFDLVKNMHHFFRFMEPAEGDAGEVFFLMGYLLCMFVLMIRSSLDEGDKAARERDPAAYPRGRAVMLQIATSEETLAAHLNDTTDTKQVAEWLLANEVIWTHARLKIRKGSAHEREKQLQYWREGERAIANAGGMFVLISFLASDHSWPEAESLRDALQVFAVRDGPSDLLVTKGIGEADLQRRGLQAPSC